MDTIEGVSSSPTTQAPPQTSGIGETERKRGRPPGTKNKPKQMEMDTSAPQAVSSPVPSAADPGGNSAPAAGEPPKRGRGRPRKDTQPATAAAPPAPVAEGAPALQAAAGISPTSPEVVAPAPVVGVPVPVAEERQAEASFPTSVAPVAAPMNRETLLATIERLEGRLGAVLQERDSLWKMLCEERRTRTEEVSRLNFMIETLFSQTQKDREAFRMDFASSLTMGAGQ
jgi:hypothetical protein